MKPTISLVSTVKAGSDYVKAFVSQLSVLTEKNCTINKIIIVTDDTSDRELVNFKSKDSRVCTIFEGIHKYNERYSEKQCKALKWSSIGNLGIDAAVESGANYLLYLEADLTFPYDLLDQLVSNNLDVVAPIIYLGCVFYDSWGFRNLDGVKINKIDISDALSKPIEVSSVGSCVLFKSEILLKNLRFKPSLDDGLLVGLCQDARDFGYKIWVDPTIAVLHPKSAWLEQIWKINQIFIKEDESIKLLCTPDLVVANSYNETVLEVVSEFLKIRYTGIRLDKIQMVRDGASRNIQIILS